MKKIKKILLIVLIAFLSIGTLLFWISFFTDDSDDPNPTPIVNNTTIINLYENPVVQNISSDASQTVKINDIELELKEVTPKEEESLLKDTSKGQYVSGITADGYKFEGRGDSIVVSTGKKKVMATTKQNPKNADSGKIAGIVSAAMEEEPYDEHTSSWNTKTQRYFIASCDCNFYYPAQLKFIKDTGSKIYFRDTKTSAEIIVTVLESGFNSDTDRYQGKSGEDIVIYQAFSEGNGYYLTATLYFPDKYSFVYDVLASKMRFEFLEYQTDMTFYDFPEAGTSVEMQEIYLPYYSCSIVIPLEFEFERSSDDIYYFRDYLKDHVLKISFAEINDSEEYLNLYNMFHVVAEDENIEYGETYIKWHNGEGIRFGAVSSYYACLMEVQGADSWESYQDCFDQFEIIFSYASRYQFYSDQIRDLIIETLLAALSEPDDLPLLGDPGDIEDMSDPGDIEDMSDPGDTRDESDAGDMGDPGDTEDELTPTLAILRDEDSLLHNTTFVDLGEPDSVVNGNICMAFYEYSDKLDKLLHELIEEYQKTQIIYFNDDYWEEHYASAWNGKISDDVYIDLSSGKSFGIQLILYTFDEVPVKEGSIIVDTDLLKSAYKGMLEGDPYNNIYELAFDMFNVEASLESVDDEEFWQNAFYVTGKVGDYKIEAKDPSSKPRETKRTYSFRDLKLYKVLDDGTEVFLN